MLHHAVTLAKPGDVLVASICNYVLAGAWGEILTVAAQARGIAQSEGLADRVGQHDDPFGLDGSPTEDASARVARDAEDEIGGLDGRSLEPRRPWPSLDPMHLHDQPGSAEARDQRSQRCHVEMAAEDDAD
jgi:hypothetical protein